MKKRELKLTNNMKEIRRAKGLTARELVEALGVAKESVVYAWEGGRRVPWIGDALRIAKILGVRVDEIWNIEEAQPREVR